MPTPIIATTLRETITNIAQAMCIVWEADADTPAVYAESFRIHDADLRHSLIAHMPDGAFVGIGILCRRGDRGFVLDFGIAPSFRGKKYGHRLIAAMVEQMRQARLHEVSLIVAANNQAAIRIYQKAGFRQTRELVSLRGKVPAYAPGSAHELRSADIPSSVIAWFGPGRSTTPYWERDLPSLLAMGDTRAFENGEGFLLCRRSPYHKQVDMVHLGLSSAAVAENLNALLYAASVAYGDDLPLTLPEEPRDSRAYEMLYALGFRPSSRAYEMRLKL